MNKDNKKMNENLTKQQQQQNIQQTKLIFIRYIQTHFICNVKTGRADAILKKRENGNDVPMTALTSLIS
jgi:hypothetical protein